MLAVCLFIFLAGMVRYEKSPVYDNSVLMSYAFGPQKTYYENSSEEDVSFDESLDYLKKTVTQAAENGAGLIAYAEEAFIIDRKIHTVVECVWTVLIVLVGVDFIRVILTFIIKRVRERKS